MAISFDDLSTAYNQYSTQESKSTSKLENTLKSDMTGATDEELMDACKEFEAYFTEQLFKAMEKMVPKDEESESGSSTLDYFKDTLIQEYANNSADNGSLGIANMLFEQMKRNYSASEIPSADIVEAVATSDTKSDAE